MICHLKYLHISQFLSYNQSGLAWLDRKKESPYRLRGFIWFGVGGGGGLVVCFFFLNAQDWPKLYLVHLLSLL